MTDRHGVLGDTLASSVRGATTTVDELLAACKAQHNVIDILLAMLMTRSTLEEPFLPSHHPEIWQGLVQGYNAIACTDPAWAHKRRQSGI